MATYVVGDIQGCFDELIHLLETINFNEQIDHLICAGDIINRGPKSLETIQFLANLPNCTVTLGNHDLYLLKEYYVGQTKEFTDTIDEIIQSKYASDLCEWLRHQPFLYHDQTNDIVVCHAGIYPHWSLQSAKAYAKEIEDALQNGNYTKLLTDMAPSSPTEWSENLTGIDRYGFLKNSFTLMRYIVDKNKLDFTVKCNPKDANEKYTPWFNIKNNKLKNEKIIFGHWSALEGKTNSDKHICIDTGCSWGKSLTVINIDDLKKTSVKSKHFLT